MFVTCDNCAERFHMRPGTTAWTCPNCGHEHGSATMVDLGAEQPTVPVTVVARHAAPPKVKVKRPPTRRKLAALAALGIAAVLILAFALSSLGAERQAAPSTSSTTSTPPPSSVSPTEALCLHLRDLQTPREDSLTRLATTLDGDAAAVAAEGKQKLAEAIQRVKAAVLAYRDALQSQGDLTAAAAQLGAALQQTPCG